MSTDVLYVHAESMTTITNATRLSFEIATDWGADEHAGGNLYNALLLQLRCGHVL